MGKTGIKNNIMKKAKTPKVGVVNQMSVIFVFVKVQTYKLRRLRRSNYIP